jgi:peptide subunit release factor 1 (eRF1)
VSKERTPILTHRQIQDLGRFRPTPYLVTSLYLDTGRMVPGSGGRSTTLKALAREVKAGLDDRGYSRRQRQSIEEDLAVLERLARDAAARGDRAVVAFVASGVDYEQAHGLPHPLKSRLVVDETPYIRPLAALLAEYPRYLVVLVDRSHARLLAAHMGRVRQLGEVESDVPGHVREGGYRGMAERGIERHIDDHVTRHLKQVAEAARESFGDSDYDQLVLGGPAEAVSALQGLLGSDLRSRVAGEIAAPMEATLEEVSARCRDLLTEGAARRDHDLLERLGQGLSSSGLAVAAVLPTLGALRRGAVATLLVAQDHEIPGTECRDCGLLGLEGDSACPACGRTGSRALPDLIREMIDRAGESGAAVCHVGTEPALGRLKAMGGVGALLRFRLT